MTLSLYIGLFRYTCSLFNAFENDLQKINQINFEMSSCIGRHKTILRYSLISMIKYQIEIYQVMDSIQKAMNGPFFKQLFTYAIFIVHSLNSPVSENN